MRRRSPTWLPAPPCPAPVPDRHKPVQSQNQAIKPKFFSILEKAESDSSHYESYGEEEDDEDELVKDRAHYIQWSSSQPCLRPAPESRICAYLWRRKWLGQWAKQLFIVRNDVLLVRGRGLLLSDLFCPSGAVVVQNNTAVSTINATEEVCSLLKDTTAVNNQGQDRH